MMRVFLDFVDRFDPDFKRRIRGVSQGDVDRLAAVYERELPPSYVDFLRTMGADLGGFSLYSMAQADYDSVYEWAYELKEEGIIAHVLRERILIGENYCPGFHVALPIGTPGEPPVVSTDLVEDRPLARSLLHLLMRQAFARYALRSQPHRRAWANSALNDKRKAPRLITDSGFEPLWFTDEFVWCGVRNGAWIIIDQVPTEPILVEVSSHDPAVLDEVGRVVEGELGLSTSKVHVWPRTP